MTRFADVRATVIKQTGGYETTIAAEILHEIATPRLLSPFQDALRSKPRHGVDRGDILRPQHNRASRRDIGRTRPRRRLGGVAIHPTRQPWKTSA